ncbi:MAG: site-2 protease family protein [Chloroflexota bacterium]|nr:site-2 protease family protein [Chloroflexota bacterium]
MKSSINLGKIFGIDLKINITFLYLLLWVMFLNLLGGATPGAALAEMIFIIALFVLVVLHELGHALMAKRFGINTQDITLLPIGGLARLEKMPEDPKQEFLVAIAGPTVNLIIGGLLFFGLLVTGFFNQPLSLGLVEGNLWTRLLAANITLFLFNLIPAFPMDGGRVLRSLLSLRMDPVKATSIAANIGKGAAALIGILGFIFNPWLVLTAIFIWVGANSEANNARIQASIKGLQVQDAMMTKFFQVEGNQPLESVLQLSIQTGQHHIPVTSNGHFLGIIQRGDLLNALQRLGDRAPAYAAISFEPEGLSPTTSLKDALPSFLTHRVQPVIEDGQLIGLITLESIQQRMWLDKEMRSSQKSSPDEKADMV